MSPEDDWSDYETGPFCRHWFDPSDCAELCATCGHGCTDHGATDGDYRCLLEGCECKTWIDKEPSR